MPAVALAGGGLGGRLSATPRPKGRRLLVALLSLLIAAVVVAGPGVVAHADNTTVVLGSVAVQKDGGVAPLSLTGPGPEPGILAASPETSPSPTIVTIVLANNVTGSNTSSPGPVNATRSNATSTPSSPSPASTTTFGAPPAPIHSPFLELGYPDTASTASSAETFSPDGAPVTPQALRLATGDWITLRNVAAKRYLTRGTEQRIRNAGSLEDDDNDMVSSDEDDEKLNNLEAASQAAAQQQQAQRPSGSKWTDLFHFSSRSAQPATPKKRPRLATYTSRLRTSNRPVRGNRSCFQVEVVSANTVRLRAEDLSFLTLEPKTGLVVAGAWEIENATVFSVELVLDGVIRLGLPAAAQNSTTSYLTYRAPNKGRLVRRNFRDLFRRRKKRTDSDLDDDGPVSKADLRTIVMAPDAPSDKQTNTTSTHWTVGLMPRIRRGYAESVAAVQFDTAATQATTSERQVVSDLIFPNESGTTQQMQYAFQANLGLTQSVQLSTIGTFETVSSFNWQFTPVLISVLTGSGSTQVKFAIQRGKFSTETISTIRQQTFTFSLQVGARRQVRASASALFANANIPFTASVTRQLVRWNGDRFDTKCTYPVQGVLKEENFSEQRYHVGEDEPVETRRDPKIIKLGPVGTAIVASTKSANTTPAPAAANSTTTSAPPALQASRVRLEGKLGRTRHDFLSPSGTFGPTVTHVPRNFAMKM